MENQQLPIDFGDLAIRLDPWQVDYGDQTLVESPAAEPGEGIDVDLEVEGHLRPIVPTALDGDRPPLIFVDGVRRLEARPTATLCIDCKTLDEIREKQRG